MSMGSLSRAVSGLMANQAGLNTTAHNLANVNTPGYVRQQVLMNDSPYAKVGANATTGFQVGFGTDVNKIRQVRDQFLDLAYRAENGRLGFYGAETNTIREIENIFGEMEGEAFSKAINNLLTSVNELAKHPDGLETRGTFIQNAVLFVEKSNLIAEQLVTYQNNMNTKVAEKVDRINQIGKEIYALNEVISGTENSGASANDYRDQRNALLDELSNLVNTSYKEDLEGNVLVKVENVSFVTKSNVNEMGLIEAENKSNLKDPFWPHLSNATVTYKVFDVTEKIGPQLNNDKGELKGIVLNRGARKANYLDLDDPVHYERNIKKSSIMTVQAQFDKLVHGIVTKINDIVAPHSGGVLDTKNAPFGTDGSQGFEIFSRKHMDRFTSLPPASGPHTYNPEDPNNDISLYSIGNLKINEDVLNNYNHLCLSAKNGEHGDSSVVQKIIDEFDKPFSELAPGSSGTLKFFQFYNGMISDLGSRGNSAIKNENNQKAMVSQIDNQRLQVTGVSSDEELNNMMRYQHAYNASARVVSTIDKMIERVIDQLKR